MDDHRAVFVDDQGVNDACDITGGQHGNADDLRGLPVVCVDGILWCVGEVFAAIVFDHAAAEDGKCDSGQLE